MLIDPGAHGTLGVDQTEEIRTVATLMSLVGFTRQKPWCQMLDGRCEKVLRKSPLLLKSGKFFITRDLEMGVVAITSYHPTIASILNDLSKGDRDGNRISQVPNSNDP